MDKRRWCVRVKIDDVEETKKATRARARETVIWVKIERLENLKWNYWSGKFIMCQWRRINLPLLCFLNKNAAVANGNKWKRWPVFLSDEQVDAMNPSTPIVPWQKGKNQEFTKKKCEIDLFHYTNKKAALSTNGINSIVSWKIHAALHSAHKQIFLKNIRNLFIRFCFLSVYYCLLGWFRSYRSLQPKSHYSQTRARLWHFPGSTHKIWRPSEAQWETIRVTHFIFYLLFVK